MAAGCGHLIPFVIPGVMKGSGGVGNAQREIESTISPLTPVFPPSLRPHPSSRSG
jgi:hypothetical protein